MRPTCSTWSARCHGCLLGPHDDSILRALCRREHFRACGRDVDARPYAGERARLPVSCQRAGWSSGDLSTMSGLSPGISRLTTFSRVMAAFRRAASSSTLPGRKSMLDRRFGIDVTRDTALGRIYAKGGFWSYDNGRFVEQSKAFFLPRRHGARDPGQFAILHAGHRLHGQGPCRDRGQYRIAPASNSSS